MCIIYGFLSHKTCKISFFFGNLRYFVEFFCHGLRAFVWRKIDTKVVSVEKTGQISCMAILGVISKVNQSINGLFCLTTP